MLLVTVNVDGKVTAPAAEIFTAVEVVGPISMLPALFK